MSFINAHAGDIAAYDAYCDNLSDPPDEEPEMSRHHIIAEVIAHQLKQHGYHLTEKEALDVAGNALMAIDAMADNEAAQQPAVFVGSVDELEQHLGWSPAHGDRQ